MTRPTCVIPALIALAAAAAIAQSPPTAEQYQDALNQLKRLQDDKNKLATDNTKLRQQIADGEKKLTEQAELLESTQSRAYYLREHYATWGEFLDLYPSVRSMWAAFAASAEAADRALDLLGDGRWPFSVEG